MEKPIYKVGDIIYAEESKLISKIVRIQRHRQNYKFDGTYTIYLQNGVLVYMWSNSSTSAKKFTINQRRRTQSENFMFEVGKTYKTKPKTIGGYILIYRCIERTAKKVKMENDIGTHLIIRKIRINSDGHECILDPYISSNQTNKENKLWTSETLSNKNYAHTIVCARCALTVSLRINYITITTNTATASTRTRVCEL